MNKSNSKGPASSFAKWLYTQLFLQWGWAKLDGLHFKYIQQHVAPADLLFGKVIHQRNQFIPPLKTGKTCKSLLSINWKCHRMLSGSLVASLVEVTEDGLFRDHWVAILQVQVQLLFLQKCLVYPFSFLKGHFWLKTDLGLPSVLHYCFVLFVFFFDRLGGLYSEPLLQQIMKLCKKNKPVYAS